MPNSTDEMLIPSNAKRRRKSESERKDQDNKDRLSDLSDCILLHILSSVSAKYVVQTCVLSKRWKDLWKHLPTLILQSPDFSFVDRLLTLRDRSTALHCLYFECYSPIPTHLLKMMVKYAVSHNVQRLGLTVECDIKHFPHCIFSSQTLTSLKLFVQSKRSILEKMFFPESLNLPALTNLHLLNFAFCANGNDRRAEPFSSLIRLNSLIIEYCNLWDAQILYISSKTLANLTVLNGYFDYKMHLSSPILRKFVFRGYPCHTLSGRSISSIEHVNFNILSGGKTVLFVLLKWLEELANIKSLTISTSTLQVLSLIPNLSELKVPILGSLKSLKVKLDTDLFSSTPDGIVDFLLQNSPFAKVDIIRVSTTDNID